MICRPPNRGIRAINIPATAHVGGAENAIQLPIAAVVPANGHQSLTLRRTRAIVSATVPAMPAQAASASHTIHDKPPGPGAASQASRPANPIVI
jgi:hypothetical protein